MSEFQRTGQSALGRAGNKRDWKGKPGSPHPPLETGVPSPTMSPVHRPYMNRCMMSVRDLIIVGAGPSGLSAAIAAKQRGLDYQVLEQGALVNSIFNFPPQMVFFTTPELLEIGGLPFVSPYEKPTRAEALRYYRKVVDTFDLQIAFEETVLSIEREEEHSAEGRGRRSRRCSRSRRRRRAACAASGTRGTSSWRSATTTAELPERAGRGSAARPSLLREPHPYYRQRVVIVGGGNSAAESALELFRAGAHVTLVHRHPELKSTHQVLGEAGHREPHQGRIDRRRGSTRCSRRFGRPSVIIEGRRRQGAAQGRQEELPADAVFLLTGYRADWDLMERAGVALGETRRADLRSRDVRDQRAGPVRRRRRHLRARHQQHLHRERPLPRREDRGDDRRRGSS